MTTIYLIPTVLFEGITETIPSYILHAIRQCTVLFVENERTARRFLKSLDKEIIIDDFEWSIIHKAETEQLLNFKSKITEGKTIGIISEAGCPGIADPGQVLIAAAQQMNCIIRPLVGPSSILLALMASGMNGQQFEFAGYLPIDSLLRNKRIKELENASVKNDSTKIFIETPYRNNQLLESLLKQCNPSTLICIGVNITAANESITTKSVSSWIKNKPDLHKQPAIFLMYGGK